MTDRVNAVLVVLEQNYRTDDVEAILSAIRHIRGVAEVLAHVHQMDPDEIALSRARFEVRHRLWDALEGKK